MRNDPCIVLADGNIAAMHNKRTLDVSNALIKDLLEVPGVLKLLLNLGDDRFGKVTLLPLLDLALIANPRVEDCLGLGGNGRLLLELKCLGLKLNRLL